MAKIAIEAAYTCVVYDTVDLGDNVQFSDIKEWYVKWGCLFYTLDGEVWHEKQMECDVTDAIDWKRPLETVVHPLDADDQPVFEVSLATQEA